VSKPCLTVTPKFSAACPPVEDIRGAGNVRVIPIGGARDAGQGKRGELLVVAACRWHNGAVKTPLFAIGFRPFFILAALAAAFLIPLWVMLFTGQLSRVFAMGPISWHAHEMLFGYTGAVLAGFLLTAVRNWTKGMTPEGISLGAIVVFWLTGRVCSWAGEPTGLWVGAVADGLFWLSVAVGIGRPIISAKNWRNVAFLPLLAVLAVADIILHLQAPLWQRVAYDLALNAILIILAIVGGRIIPLFTGNAVAEAKVRERGLLDRLALASLVVLMVVDTLPITPAIQGACALLAGALHLLRMVGWGGSKTFTRPILLVLHAGYFFLALGLLAKGASGAVALFPRSIAVHLLTVGALGLLTLGMLSRVALGHTGRKLVISQVMVLGYLAITGAALVRVFVPLIWPTSLLLALWVAAGLWAVSFLVYLLLYVPILLAKRVDGKPG
jgi:uncharacterized protein involved in response to NO